MNKFLRNGFGGLLVVLAGLMPRAASAAASEFDFAYRISGDQGLRPVQVFADGSRTYFQLAPGTSVPLILEGPQQVRVQAQAEGVLQVVQGRAEAYTLMFGGRQARVEHLGTGVSADGGPTAPGVAGQKAPEGARGSYATPLRGDEIEWVAPDRTETHDVVFAEGGHRLPGRTVRALKAVHVRLGAGARVDVTGSADVDDDRLSSRRVRAVVQALLAAGVPSSRIRTVDDVAASLRADSVAVTWRIDGRPITSAPAFPPASPGEGTRPRQAQGALGRPVVGQFDLLLSDRTVSTSLRRWAAHAGAPLAWTAPLDAPITGELTVDARHLADAVEKVVAGLQAAGYPLQLERRPDGGLQIRQAAGP